LNSRGHKVSLQRKREPFSILTGDALPSLM
jgi:hypothetical protein